MQKTTMIAKRRINDGKKESIEDKKGRGADNQALSRATGIRTRTSKVWTYAQPYNEHN